MHARTRPAAGREPDSRVHRSRGRTFTCTMGMAFSRATGVPVKQAAAVHPRALVNTALSVVDADAYSVFRMLWEASASRAVGGGDRGGAQPYHNSTQSDGSCELAEGERLTTATCGTRGKGPSCASRSLSSRYSRHAICPVRRPCSRR